MLKYRSSRRRTVMLCVDTIFKDCFAEFPNAFEIDKFICKAVLGSRSCRRWCWSVMRPLCARLFVCESRGLVKSGWQLCKFPQCGRTLALYFSNRPIPDPIVIFYTGGKITNYHSVFGNSCTNYPKNPRILYYLPCIYAAV